MSAKTDLNSPSSPAQLARVHSCPPPSSNNFQQYNTEEGRRALQIAIFNSLTAQISSNNRLIEKTSDAVLVSQITAATNQLIAKRAEFCKKLDRVVVQE